jgi:iron complex transport system substrate-binding protein
MKKILSIIVAVALAMCLFGCGAGGNTASNSSTTFPMTVTDGVGNEVTLEQEPQKIVSLSPNCTEILYAIGAGDKVIGVSSYCNYPEEATTKEVLGDAWSANIERIIELDADLVMVSGIFSANNVSMLAQYGIAVYSVDASTPEELYEQIQTVGNITGCSKQAKNLVNDLEKDLASLLKKLNKVESKKVFIDYGDLYSSSKVDFIGNLLTLIGAENIANDYDYSSPQLSAEAVIEANPDVYIYNGMSGPEYVTLPAGFENINAFINGEVYYISYDDVKADMISRQGPRFVEGLTELAKMIYPDAF